MFLYIWKYVSLRVLNVCPNLSAISYPININRSLVFLAKWDIDSTTIILPLLAKFIICLSSILSVFFHSIYQQILCEHLIPSSILPVLLYFVQQYSHEYILFSYNLFNLFTKDKEQLLLFFRLFINNSIYIFFYFFTIILCILYLYLHIFFWYKIKIIIIIVWSNVKCFKYYIW